MDVGGPAWDEAVRGWRRLIKRTSARSAATPVDGVAALDALADIGMVRRLLDHVELASVRAARRDGKSWAEIATNLGVTRQSAWERWRDLDDSSDPSFSTRSSEAATEPEQNLDPEHAIDLASEAVVDQSTAPRRGRRSGGALVAVPDVVTLSATDARNVLIGAGLEPLLHTGGQNPTPLKAEILGIVVDQVPKNGARRRPGSPVTVWVTGAGGSAGVREPRRPAPTPRSGRAEPSGDERIGQR
jgi:hypothetical protein